MNAIIENIGAIGLFLDIVGAVVIFIYGVPHNLNPNGHIPKMLEQVDQDAIKKYKKYKRLSNLGLILLILGFSLQLISQIK